MEQYAYLMVWVVIFGLMWFFWIRPQQKRNRERQELLESLEKGDQVVTIGGIHGTIARLRDDTVNLRIADQVEIKMDRHGIGRRRSAE